MCLTEVIVTGHTDIDFLTVVVRTDIASFDDLIEIIEKVKATKDTVRITVDMALPADG